MSLTSVECCGGKKSFLDCYVDVACGCHLVTVDNLYPIVHYTTTLNTIHMYIFSVLNVVIKK